jgi:hypothetical protein
MVEVWVFFLDVQTAKRKRVHFVILNVGMATNHQLLNVKGPVRMEQKVPDLHV